MSVLSEISDVDPREIIAEIHHTAIARTFQYPGNIVHTANLSNGMVLLLNKLLFENNNTHPLLNKIIFKICDNKNLSLFGLLLSYLSNNKNKINLQNIEFKFDAIERHDHSVHQITSESSHFNTIYGYNQTEIYSVENEIIQINCTDLNEWTLGKIYQNTIDWLQRALVRYGKEALSKRCLRCNLF